MTAEELGTFATLRRLIGAITCRRARGVAAWVAALVLGALYLDNALGVDGHVSIDFGGQWLVGRMVADGEGDQLYRIPAGRESLAKGYQGKDLDHVVRRLLLKDRDEPAADGVEGPPLPPTAGLLFAPVMRLSPEAAHRLVVLFYLLFLVPLCGWLMSRLTGLQTGVAVLLILAFPNLFMSLLLGQNAILTLSMVVTGLFLLARQRPLLGGIVWGLLAYKPVFVVALLLVPLALRSGRLLVGMLGSGLLFVLLTLPAVGIDAWVRWFQVGQHNAEIYANDRNWIWMSRDLMGLPRRQMWDADGLRDQAAHLVGRWDPAASWFESEPDGERRFRPSVRLLRRIPHDPDVHQRIRPGGVQTSVGIALLVLVALLTLWIGSRTGARARQSDAVPFVLLGSLLCVYHFMHYDLLVFALPVLLLLGEWSRSGRAARWFIGLWLALLLAASFNLNWGAGVLAAPVETLLLLILWGFAGLVVLRRAR